MWAQIGCLLLGIWLLIAPDALGYSDPARSVERAIGPVVIVVAALAIRGVTHPVRRLNTLTGLALLVAPWLFVYASIPAIMNSAVVGMAVLGFSLVRGHVAHTYAGGWSSVWKREQLTRAAGQEQEWGASRGDADIARAG